MNTREVLEKAIKDYENAQEREVFKLKSVTRVVDLLYRLEVNSHKVYMRAHDRKWGLLGKPQWITNKF
jgi:hypothetical protein